MKKRTFLFIFALLFCIVLTSCNGTVEETTAPITEAVVEETQPYIDGIVLFAPGVCEYRIVYPSDDTDEEFNAARRLQDLIEEKCGVKPEIVRSKSVSGDNYDPNAKEILLSFVDFVEFDCAIAGTPYTKAICQALGNKIVVTGHEREGFADAFENFLHWIDKQTEDGTCILPAGFWSICDGSSHEYRKFKDVPGYPGGKIEDISELGDGYYQVTIYDTDREMYEGYEAVVTAEGYALYSENEISGNSYSTYTKDEKMLYYYYCENTGETRIITASRAKLPSLEAPEYKKVCEPAYITLKVLDDTGTVKGDAQGAIIRFEDGSFLVYDGGNKNTHQAKHIYDTLVEYAPDPKNIVIRAWMFSHFHSDHTGAFQAFVARYKNAKTFTVECFIYNFCNTTEQTQTISNGQMISTEDAIDTLSLNIPVYKCMTGQIYRFPGMDMEILATMSDFIPQVIGYEAADADLTKGDGNTMTVVSRLTTLSEKNTCMLTGDATNIVLNCMVDRYGAEYLDSNIVTTPHHAHNRDSYRARNATIKFYDAVKPDILVVTSTTMSKFSPTSKYAYEVNVHVIKTYNPVVYLMNKVSLISMSTLKEIK